MKAQELLRELKRAHGLKITLAGDGRLAVYPWNRATSDIRALIRANKAALVAWLSSGVEAEPARKEEPAKEEKGTHAQESLRRLKAQHGVSVSLSPSGRLDIWAPEKPPAWLLDAINDASPWYVAWLSHLELARSCPVLSAWLVEAVQELQAGRWNPTPEERWNRWADHAALEGMAPEAIWEREVFEELVGEELEKHLGGSGVPVEGSAHSPTAEAEPGTCSAIAGGVWRPSQAVETESHLLDFTLSAVRFVGLARVGSSRFWESYLEDCKECGVQPAARSHFEAVWKQRREDWSSTHPGSGDGLKSSHRKG